MWDRARASATAGLDRMHRRHLTGTASGIASYEAPSADKHKHASEAPMAMSWTTISTSTSSSTFYQTNVDGPANALGIDIGATSAATPQRPQRPHRQPRVENLDARVTSALHTGMYVLYGLFLSLHPAANTHNGRGNGCVMHGTCTLYPALEPFVAASFANVYCLPSLPKHIPVRLLRAQPPADARQTRKRQRKKQGAVLFCIGIFDFPSKKLALAA